MAPEVSSCRTLGAFVTVSRLSAVTSLALFGAPLEDGGGAGSFGPGSFSTFLRSLLSIFPIFYYSRYLTMFAFFLFWRYSSFHFPGEDLLVRLILKLLLTSSGKTSGTP